MIWNSIFDAILRIWWDNKWKKSKILYNAKGAGNIDVRSVLYTSPEGWIELNKAAKTLTRYRPIDGTLNEDLTMQKIAQYVNYRTRYVSDIQSKGKNEFWKDAYETYTEREGDCDDYAILIKMLSLAAGIPDWRVKCCCLDIKYPDGSVGGHMNVLYLERETNEWTFVEGSWNGGIETYGNIWFTFNRENGWAQHTITFDRYSLRKLKELGEQLQ